MCRSVALANSSPIATAPWHIDGPSTGSAIHRQPVPHAGGDGLTVASQHLYQVPPGNEADHARAVNNRHRTHAVIQHRVTRSTTSVPAPIPITGMVITAPTVAAGTCIVGAGDAVLVGVAVARIAPEAVAHEVGLGNDADQTTVLVQPAVR
jgi:hypothetical protein